MEKLEIDLEETDLYISQLREVFDSCDTWEKGYLDRSQLIVLCQKLQLAEQADEIVDQLLLNIGDITRRNLSKKVTFEQFKSTFVHILCQTAAKLNQESHQHQFNTDNGETSNREHNTDSDMSDDRDDIPPVYTKDGKRYGRRSKPLIRLHNDLDVDEVKVRNKEDRSWPMRRTKGDNNLRDSLSSLSDEDRETFEAEGQLNLNMSEMEQTTEEDYLRNIWRTLGVGQQGYITLSDLATVCDHIGMSEMDDNELQQLFDKLDSDADGRVSFDEFLHGLQHNSPPCPPTPRTLGTPTPRTHSAQKKIKLLASASAEERLTPSIVLGSGVSGLFTTIDPANSGFAMPDCIIDLWEKYNVSNGADIILALGFDLNTKVSLSELSSYLEQELINADDQNAVYQAALSSYQQEIRHLKSTLEQFNWETDKLKQDLLEANHRNTKLAKEVDERHAHMEQSTEKKLLTVEKKYQEQIKVLQSELEHEREHYSTQAVTQTTALEGEMEQLRQEDRKLRESLAQAQKEIEKLEQDLIDSVERRTDLQKQNTRLQRELQSVNDLQRKLDESIGGLSPEEQKVSEEKMERVRNENKDLKDRNDELTAELETMKQFPALKKKCSTTGRSPRGFGSRIPVLEGSLLSDYIRAGRRGVRSSLSSETSDDETQSSGSTGLTPNYSKRTRRKLPKAPDDEAGSVGSIQNDKEQIENLKKELIDLKNHMESEHKKIKRSYEVELSKLEESHEKQKVELLKKFEEEKGKIYEDCEQIKQAELATHRQQLQEGFVGEKQDLIDKHKSEKVLMQQQFTEEKESIIKNLQAEFARDLEAQVATVREDYARDKAELEAFLTRPDESQLQQLEQEKAELEEKLYEQQEETERHLEEERSKCRTESEANRREELKTLRTEFETENNKLRTELNVNSEKEIQRLKNKFDEERTKLTMDHESSRDEDKREFDKRLLQQREKLEEKFGQERETLEDAYETQLWRLNGELQVKIKDYDDSLSKGVDALKGKTKEDFCNLLSREKELLVVQQRDEIAVCVEKEKAELETQYTGHIQELEQTFGQEKEDLRDQYEGQVVVLRSQLDRLTVRLEEERDAMERRFDEERETLEEELSRTIRDELEDEFTQQVEQLKSSFESEKSELQHQIGMYREETEELERELEERQATHRADDEFRNTITTLQREKLQAEKAQGEIQRSLEETKYSLEARIENLLSEREEVITAVKASEVQMVKESVDKEKADMEKEISKLRRKALELDVDNQRLSALQETAYEDWDQEKKDYLDRIHDLERQVKDSTSIPPHAQSMIDRLERQRDDLNNTLASAKNKLQDVDQKVKQMAKQQKAYNTANANITLENQNLHSRVDLLHNDLGETATDLEREKEKMMALQLEKDRLENELTKVSNQLKDTNNKLVDHRKEHESEISKLKDMNSNSLDLEKFTRLQIDLVDHQRQLRDLHDVLEAKENEKNRTFKVKEDEYKEIMKDLEEEKTNLRRKLRLTQEMLDEQLEKIKSHYSDCNEKNLLVVDLYKENANMMETLFKMEERKKDAVSRCYRLEDQCTILRKMLKKAIHVAVS